MGKIAQGILGAVSGKVGGVVGAVWKGIAYIRTMPASVANPKTAAQQAQRGKFSSVVQVARLLLSDLVQTFWDPFARYMSGYNAFIKQNIDAFDTSGLLTPADFSAARGTLMASEFMSLVASEAAGTLTFDWDDNSGKGDALGTDDFHCLLYNATQDYWLFFSPAVTRSDAAVVLTDPDLIENDGIHFYPFFSRPDISKISDSVYKQTSVSA